MFDVPTYIHIIIQFIDIKLDFETIPANFR